jgi:hypothetical protein
MRGMLCVPHVLWSLAYPTNNTLPNPAYVLALGVWEALVWFHTHPLRTLCCRSNFHLLHVIRSIFRHQCYTRHFHVCRSFLAPVSARHYYVEPRTWYQCPLDTFTLYLIHAIEIDLLLGLYRHVCLLRYHLPQASCPLKCCGPSPPSSIAAGTVVSPWHAVTNRGHIYRPGVIISTPIYLKRCGESCASRPERSPLPTTEEI